MINYFKNIARKIIFKLLDKDTENLEKSFYNWLLLRLIRVKKLTKSYPFEYYNLHNWESELNRRINQLDQLVISDKRDFTNYSYLKKDLVKKYNTSNLSILAYNECAKDFNEWLIKNLSNLNI